MLNDEVPVFVATFQTQEIFCFRNAITKEIAAGSPNEVVGVNYAVVIGRVEEELDDEVTGGWKVLEVSPSHLSYVVPESDERNADASLSFLRAPRSSAEEPDSRLFRLCND